MKRTFLAISIPSGTEYPLLVQQLQKKLQHEQKNINWCKPNQIHLTLKFVGETADQDVPAIIEACQKVAKNHQPFTMDFNRTDFSVAIECLGYFGWVCRRPPKHCMTLKPIFWMPLIALAICVIGRILCRISQYAVLNIWWTSNCFCRFMNQ